MIAVKSLEKKLWLALLVLAGLLFTLSAGASTLWTGPTTNFINISGSDPTQPTNQDRLTPGVWITRATTEGIYNAATESGFTQFFSPQDTAWANGTLSNYASLSYTDWNTWAKNVNGGPPSTIGVSAVVHLVAEDIYLSVTFASWGGAGGGFSWVRSTPPPTDIPPTVSITSPSNNASFTAPAVVPITATAADPDGIVTNVSFFDGTTLLGLTNNAPYTVTATFGAGVHSLTAVATDNAGLSTTSAVVAITVSGPNTRLNVSMSNNQVNLSWSVPGAQLQVQTNGLNAGNWFNVVGSTATNQSVVPIDPSQASVFYRLLFP